MSKKTWVCVNVSYDTNGSITPLSVEWDDGRKLPIDQIIKCVPLAPCFACGGSGARYEIRIKNRYYYLYNESESGRFFVIRKHEEDYARESQSEPKQVKLVPLMARLPYLN